MNGDDSRFIQRKITFKSLEIHPTEQSLIINCEVEASLVSDNFADSFLERTRDIQKVVRLKSLEETSDIDAIVSQVISKSKGLLSELQRDEIRQSILYLKNRSSNQNRIGIGSQSNSNSRPKTAGGRLSNGSATTNGLNTNNTSNSSLQNGRSNNNLKSVHTFDPSIDSFTHELSRSLNSSSLIDSEPSINNLDDYIELLYEDLPEKLKSAAMVYKLSLDHVNLVLMVENEPLMCALSRLIREEGRKNIDLTTVIIATFANLSVYSQFHPAITRFKIGSMCLEVVQSELEKEMSSFRELAEMQNSITSEYRHLSNSMTMSSSSQSQSNVSTNSAPLQPQPQPQSLNGPLQSKLQSTASLANEYEKSLRRYQTLITKQNLLFRASFFMLLNLSEDKSIEMKMVNKGIVVILVKVLERENWCDLLKVVLMFLKKLSIFEENKDMMIHLGISGKLINIVDGFNSLETSPQVIPALELIHNLLFDRKFRHEVVAIGIIQRLQHLLAKTKFQCITIEELVYQIMYILSSEEKIRMMFNMASDSNVNCVSALMARIMKLLSDKSNKNFVQLIGLLINLATNIRNAQLMCDKGNLKKLIESITRKKFSGKSVAYEDILIMKLIRNISLHEDAYKMVFLDYLPSLVRILVQHEPEPISRRFEEDSDENLADTMIIELLGIIGNLMNISAINWLQIAQSHGLWAWIEKRLQIGEDSTEYEDDIILECISVLATMCAQRKACLYLIEHKVIKILVDILNVKQKEDEIVLQIIYIFHLMLKEDDTRKLSLKDESQVLKYFLDLMHDNSVEIKRVCKQSLNMIMEFEPEFAPLIKEEKFKSSNSQWLEMINRDGVELGFGCETETDQLMDFSDANYNFLTKSDDSNLKNSDDDESMVNKATVRPVSRPHTGYKTRPSTRAGSRSRLT
ncbi:kinesin associated protein 3 [Brevipalpus obovatus]|uniref:kinesin associated protein 3 n=1 Tax=Brevipalpus obovatus TaxID=246614 RepID=UPI003D9E420F